MTYPVPPRKFTSLSGLALSRTLARSLIPVADFMRDLRTQFGMRPYEVHVVRQAWSGGERGLGEPFTTSDVPILPTPRILDVSAVAEVAQSVGNDEIGAVVLDEVSGRYTEDELLGRHEDGSPPGPHEDVFYEVVFPRDNAREMRRRFFPASAPHYAAGKFAWAIRLERARPSRRPEDVDDEGGVL